MKINMRVHTQIHFDNIVDTMTCADGGIEFTNFLFTIKKLDDDAENGDHRAMQLIDILIKFSKLITACKDKKETINEN